MAFVEGSHKADGTLILAADWNQQVVDNEKFLYRSPRGRVRRAASLSIATGTETAISFDTVQMNPSAMWSASNPSRLTAPEAGLYMVTGAVRWDLQLGGVGGRWLRIKHNGTAVAEATTFPEFSPDAPPVYQNVTTVLKMAAGGYVEMVVWQNAGTTLAVTNAGDLPALSMQWMGG